MDPAAQVALIVLHVLDVKTIIGTPLTGTFLMGDDRVTTIFEEMTR